MSKQSLTFTGTSDEIRHNSVLWGLQAATITAVQKAFSALIS